MPSDCELIVVDNASKDRTPQLVTEQFPKVKLIQNDENLGFGSANNRGLAAATGEYALLLNPDAWAEKVAVEQLTDFMDEHQQAVACGGRLVHPDGRLQESAANELTLWAVFCEQTLLERLFRNSCSLSPYWVSGRHVRKQDPSPLPLPKGEGGEELPPPTGEGRGGGSLISPLRIAQVMGACLMMRRLAGEFMRFDERFFLYCEDTELCKRLRSGSAKTYSPTLPRRAGEGESEHPNNTSEHPNIQTPEHPNEIWYVPEAVFGHALGQSSFENRWRAVRYYNRGKELYFRINHGAAAAFACFLLNRMGALMRLIGWGLPALLTLGVVPRFRTQAALFARVLFGPIDPYTPRDVR